MSGFDYDLFVIGALQMDVAHALFMLVLVIAALLSTLDPIYQKRVASSPVAAVAFQVYCTWVAALVATMVCGTSLARSAVPLPTTQHRPSSAMWRRLPSQASPLS